MKSMTKLKGLVPMLETVDLRESVKFYKEVLGFEHEGFWPEDGEPSWASLNRDETVIMLVARNAHSKVERPTLTGSLYIYPESVDEAWEELKDKVEICYEIETFGYGMREFGIYDCNGYVLNFGQGVETIERKSE
jgi:uncharacterized glyoxalase superfamily protein PhnB